MNTDSRRSNEPLQSKAVHVADYLDALTPYERICVLHQVEILWAERQSAEPPKDHDVTLVGHWLFDVVQRLRSEDVDELIETAERLDETGRLSRLTDGLDPEPA